MPEKKVLTRTIWLLSIVSLLTDFAGEMLYPIMPVYLKSIGFSIALIGLLEGLAEATAGLSKGYFGKLSDLNGKRLPFVQIGYALSILSKPMMAILTYPLWVFAARTADRLGKGIRTGARDAILSGESTPGTKGTVFGFHRSMDTIGAILGPAAALVYLQFRPEDYRTLFFIAAIPGLGAVALTLFLSEKKIVPAANDLKQSFFLATFHYWTKSTKTYKQISIGFLTFTLFNSSDIFILLKAKDSGLNDSAVISTYIFYNLVYALCAYPLGILADKIGLRKIFITGLIIFGITYSLIAFSKTEMHFFGIFFLYGIYAASTEGIAKAWISNVSDKADAATALGTFSGWSSICSLLASSIAGIIWFNFGAEYTFLISGFIAILTAIYFIFIKEK